MEISPTSRPIDIFEDWMHVAQSEITIREPTAMSIATVAEDGQVHVRVVLCKQWDEHGFLFYTNYQSQKGRDLSAHPALGAVFYWDPLFRQVKISGHAEKSSRESSEAYWHSRARDSQLSQYISRQSAPVASRAELERAREDAKKRFADQEIPCPAHWGGYWIRPERIEFWIGQPNRLHDCFQFEKTNRTWTFRRLSP